MSNASVESQILCEGPHDRDFLAGYLLANGWVDARFDRDPGGKPVKGDYQFYFARRGRHLRVRPVRNDDGGKRLPNDKKVFESLRVALSVSHEWVHRLVACVDSDVALGHGDPTTTRRAQFDTVAAGHERADLIVWRTPDEVASVGVPTVHVLERVVCQALIGAHPERAAQVDAFVGGAESAKAWSWAHMARWYPEAGCTAFFAAIWADPAVRSRLMATLEGIGVHSVLDAL